MTRKSRTTVTSTRVTRTVTTVAVSRSRAERAVTTMRIAQIRRQIASIEITSSK